MILRARRCPTIMDGLAALCALLVMACGTEDSPTYQLAPSCSADGTSNVVTASTAAPTGNNVMRVTINGDLCDPDISRQYPNEPCTSVQVCTPGGTCATIKNLLVDTGSYGLRVYKSVLTAAGVTPTTIPMGGGTTLAECVSFLDGSSEWGEVGKVDLVLGGEAKISNIPIHVINHAFSSPPSQCSATESDPDTGPEDTGFSGIIGIGMFEQDCGSYCVSHAGNGMYFKCTGSSCAASSATLSQQVQNPVSMLSTDNNGTILEFPEVTSSGAASVTGYITLGIDTQSNNASAGYKIHKADAYGEFKTVFNPFSADPLYSFIDSGSSILFFPWPPPSDPSVDGALPDCGGGYGGFYCPQTTTNLAAQNLGDGGTGKSCVPFSVANASQQFASGGKMVFSNLAGWSGSTQDSVFDWGLPFFLGRRVFTGIEGKTSSLGTGPYWAY